MGCILGKLNAAADDDCPFSLSALLFPPPPRRRPPPRPSPAPLRRRAPPHPLRRRREGLRRVAALALRRRRGRPAGGHPAAPTPSRSSKRCDLSPLFSQLKQTHLCVKCDPCTCVCLARMQIGSGTYSNVYKAVDTATGRVVALKKVRVEPGAAAAAAEAARFMAREIALLRRLDGHPNVKCYMKQLLSGLEHCHNRGILHRDIKSSNLLLSKEGILKIADFGLATSYDPENMQPMTSQVVTLWYRPPELLLGATYYGVGVDLWSVGCILAELLTGEPIFPGRTEVEQLHKIFKLCGTPSEDYWTKLKLPHTTFKPYERCISEKFKDLPPSALALVDTLLSIDPDGRGTATAALNSEFFTTEPYACEPSSLPQYPPSKEMDIKLRHDKPRRKGRANASVECGKTMKARPRNAGYRGVVTPEVDGSAKAIKDIPRLITSSSVTKMERFPPPHLDAAIGYNLDTSLDSTEDIFTSSIIEATKVKNRAVFGSIDHPAGMTLKAKTRALARARARPGLKISPSSVLIGAFRPYSIGQAMEVRRKTKVHNRHKV
uniref:[RNA-polymerase]-subunit kinase n=1 Tax=Ananas comosus var. bracteatus TaxID=296719 RepID=A0A6V7QUZ4_ANACO